MLNVFLTIATLFYQCIFVAVVPAVVPVFQIRLFFRSTAKLLFDICVSKLLLKIGFWKIRV